MSNRTLQTNHEPKLKDVATSAYLIWEREIRPNGRNAEYWIQAETQLRTARLAELRRRSRKTNNAAATDDGQCSARQHPHATHDSTAKK